MAQLLSVTGEDQLLGAFVFVGPDDVGQLLIASCCLLKSYRWILRSFYGLEERNSAIRRGMLPLSHTHTRARVLDFPYASVIVSLQN